MNIHPSLVLPVSLIVATLAAPVAAQRMICIESSREVYEIDLTTGTTTQIGDISSNAGTTGGLAYDPATGTLFLTSTGNHELYRLDPTNWNAQLIGSYGVGSLFMHGLEWNSGNSTLYGYGSSSAVGGLHTINPTTGAATRIGVTGLSSFHNLGYDSDQDVMYMTNSNTDSLYTIDLGNASASLIGPLNGPLNPNGLAYNPDNQTLYVVCNNTDTLYTVDTTTGATTPVGAVGALGSGNYLGLVYIPGSGTLTRESHGCGASDIIVSGNPNLGGAVELRITNPSTPFIGFGATQLGAPVCGCILGHEWALALPGENTSFSIPMLPALVGGQLLMQGLNVGAGPCFTLTDTITMTVGN